MLRSRNLMMIQMHCDSMQELNILKYRVFLIFEITANGYLFPGKQMILINIRLVEIIPCWAL